MKNVVTLIFALFLLNTLPAQERLTNYEGDGEKALTTFIGIEENFLYILYSQGWNSWIIRENIDTDVQNGEKLRTFTTQENPKNLTLYKGGIYYVSNRQIWRYDIQSDKVDLIFEPNIIDQNPGIIISEGMLFCILEQEVWKVSLDDFAASEVDYLTEDLKIIFRSKNSSYKKVLQDSFLLRSSYFDEDGISTFNLHTGKVTRLDDDGDEQKNIVLSQTYKNQIYLIINSNSSNKTYLGTITNEDGSYSMQKMETPFEPDWPYSPRYFSQQYITSDFNPNDETITVYDLVHGGSYSYTKPEDLVLVLPQGSYFQRDNALWYIDRNNIETKIHQGESGRYSSSEIKDKKAEVAPNQFIINYIEQDKYQTLLVQGINATIYDGYRTSLFYRDRYNQLYYRFNYPNSTSKYAVIEDGSLKELSSQPKLLPPGGDFQKPYWYDSFHYNVNQNNGISIYEIGEGLNILEVPEKPSSNMVFLRAHTPSAYYFGDRKILKTNGQINPFPSEIDGWVIEKTYSTNSNLLEVRVSKGQVSNILGFVDQQERLSIPTFPGHENGFESPTTYEQIFDGDMLISAYNNDIQAQEYFFIKNENLDISKVEFPNSSTQITDISFENNDVILILEADLGYLLYKKDNNEILDLNLPLTRFLKADNDHLIFSNAIYDFKTESITTLDPRDSVLSYVNGKILSRSSANVYAYDVEDRSEVELPNIYDYSFSSLLESGQYIFRSDIEKKVIITDGTIEGTSERDIPNGLRNIGNLGLYKNKYYFRALSEQEGQEVFSLDEDSNLTAYPTYKGKISGRPLDFYVDRNFLYYSALGPDKGRQLYRLNLSNPDESAASEPTETNFTLAPNPASGRILIQSEDPFDQILIRKITGTAVLEKDITTDTNHSMSIQGLLPGVYFVHLFFCGHLIGVNKLVVS